MPRRTVYVIYHGEEELSTHHNLEEAQVIGMYEAIGDGPQDFDWYQLEPGEWLATCVPAGQEQIRVMRRRRKA